MPTISSSYTYVDNTTLEPDEHNKNVYTDSNNEGIMSTANGELDSANLSPTFKVQPEHVHPEEATLMRQDSMRETIDCFQNAFARAPADTYYLHTAPNSVWVPVPGCSLRFYQPYAASFGLLSWSFFVEGYIPITGTVPATTWSTSSAPVVGVAGFLDGSPIIHSRRNLPRTDALITDSDPCLVDTSAESRACLWFDQCHLIESVSKGYHDFQLMLYMDIVDATAADVQFERNVETLEVSSRIFQRASFGIRNAKVVTFL